MTPHYTKLGAALMFFEKKPPAFQESFCKVFGTNIRDERDVHFLTKDFCNLMWEKVNNGKVIKRKDIYVMRGDESIFLSLKHNNHHWPPSSVGGIEVIKTPEDFHESWHVIFMNLHKETEFDIFWKMLFSNGELDNFRVLYEVVDQARKEAKTARKRKKHNRLS